MRKYALLLIGIFLLAAVPAHAFTSLFGIDSSSGLNVANRSQSGDTYNGAFFGYTNPAVYSGYYIGTIAGNTDPTLFNLAINTYLDLATPASFTQLKVDVDASDPDLSDSDGSLTVTWVSTLLSGTWSTDPALLHFYAIKAANEFALYYVNPAQTSGKWSTLHTLNPGGNVPQISHFSAAVPEPGTMLLLGGLLFGLGVVNRKRIMK